VVPVFVDTSIRYTAAPDGDALAMDTDFRVYRYGPQRRRAFSVRP